MTTYIPQRFALLRGGGDKQAMAGRRAGRRRRVARAGSAGVEQHTLALAFARGETFFLFFFLLYSCSYLFGTLSIPIVPTYSEHVLFPQLVPKKKHKRKIQQKS